MKAKHAKSKTNVPKVGDWINLDNKAYRVEHVDYLRKSGWLNLKLLSMLDVVSWVEYSPSDYFEKTSYPFVIFHEA